MPHSIDPDGADAMEAVWDSGESTRRRRLEWPTLGLAALIYGGWIGATLWHDKLDPLVLAILGGWLIAWHGSLQHEAIHGHPTPWRAMNTLIAAPPLSLWLPYEIYRRTHLQHHASEELTHPAYDPEARYLRAGSGWRCRAAARLQSTLAGRIVVGPLIEVAQFALAEARRVWRGEEDGRRIWLVHLAAVALVWAWLHFVCGMNLTKYLACFVYPGLALSLVRSFAEHRADPTPGHRVAVVERAPIFGLLFLNNNLHAAHHAWPGLPWWRLPARYRSHRTALLQANGGLVYDGYRDVFVRFLMRPHDVLEHPMDQAGRVGDG